jgi:hypothetical protein
VAVSFALVTATVLVGCGGDEPGAGATATVSPTATPTPTPTPTVDVPVIPEPVLPDEAKARTPEGATAFVRYAVDVINRAYLTGDTASIWAIANPECTVCELGTSDIDEAYARGNRIEGGQISIESTDWVDMGPNVRPTVPTVIDISELQEVTPAGQVVASAEADENLAALWDLEWDQGRWLLANMRVVS